MELYRYGVIYEEEQSQTYVFGSHQIALYFWVKAIEKRMLETGALLIHIDYHPDFDTPPHNFDKILPSEKISEYIEQSTIRYDSFITCAISMGIIQDIAFCCHPSQQENMPEFTNYETPIRVVDILNKYRNGKPLCDEEIQLCRKVMDGNMILDIDLNYFLRPDKKGFLVPKSEATIAREIDAVNKLYKYASITTIATSPNIGNKKKGYQKFVQEIFSKYFAGRVAF